MSRDKQEKEVEPQQLADAENSEKAEDHAGTAGTSKDVICEVNNLTRNVGVIGLFDRWTHQMTNRPIVPQKELTPTSAVQHAMRDLHKSVKHKEANKQLLNLRRHAKLVFPSTTRADRIIQDKADDRDPRAVQLEGRGNISDAVPFQLKESDLTYLVMENKEGLTGDEIHTANAVISRLQHTIRALRNSQARTQVTLKQILRQKENALDKLHEVLGVLKERDRALAQVQEQLKKSEDARKQLPVEGIFKNTNHG